MAWLIYYHHSEFLADFFPVTSGNFQMQAQFFSFLLAHFICFICRSDTCRKKDYGPELVAGKLNSLESVVSCCLYFLLGNISHSPTSPISIFFFWEIDYARARLFRHTFVSSVLRY
jgi:hypothetical protein